MHRRDGQERHVRGTPWLHVGRICRAALAQRGACRSRAAARGPGHVRTTGGERRALPGLAAPPTRTRLPPRRCRAHAAARSLPPPDRAARSRRRCRRCRAVDAAAGRGGGASPPPPSVPDRGGRARWAARTGCRARASRRASCSTTTTPTGAPPAPPPAARSPPPHARRFLQTVDAWLASRPVASLWVGGQAYVTIGNKCTVFAVRALPRLRALTPTRRSSLTRCRRSCWRR